MSELENNKYNFTKSLMIEALIKLLNHKDFMSINVKELCLVAGINRSTFYAHYDNTFELLNDVCKHLVDDFINTFPKENIEQFKEGKFNKDYISTDFLIPYLSHIKDNKILYKTFLKIKYNFYTDEYFEKIIKNVSLPVSKKLANNINEQEIKYITKFYISGIRAIIDEWMNNNFKEDVTYIAKLIEDLKIKY